MNQKKVEEPKRIESLTPEQEKLLLEVRDEWIDHAIGGRTTIDEPVAIESIHWLYSLADLPPPEEVILCDSPLDACLRARKLGAKVESTAYLGIGYDSSWLSFYDFFRRIGVCDHEGLVKMIRFAMSGVWDTVLLRGYAFLSRRPDSVSRDDRDRWHNPIGPSVHFLDGYELYHWHGVNVPKEWIMAKETVDPALALTHPNIEQRRALCEILGWSKVLASLPTTVIDQDPDPEIGTLIEVDLPDAGKTRFLKVLCGTKREFVLCVDNEAKTAREANAASYGFKLEQFKPEIRT